MKKTLSMKKSALLLMNSIWLILGSHLIKWAIKRQPKLLEVDLAVFRGRSKMTSPGEGGREVNKNGDFHCFRLQIPLFLRWQGGEGGVAMVIFMVTSFLKGPLEYLRMMIIEAKRKFLHQHLDIFLSNQSSEMLIHGLLNY